MRKTEKIVKTFALAMVGMVTAGNAFAAADVALAKAEVTSAGVVVGSVADVINGEDGTVYRVTGKVSSILDTRYGNWYLEDDTGRLYIYGTVDNNGQYPFTSWESFGIEEGKTITVQGPKSTYRSTPELVDVRVLDPLTLLSSRFTEIDSNATDVTGNLYCLGSEVEVSISPEQERSWLTVECHTEGNDTRFVVHADANPGPNRQALITFSTSYDGQPYEVTIQISQLAHRLVATTIEGVEIQFRVVWNGEKKTCGVWATNSDSSTSIATSAAIDYQTTGHVTIPEEVDGYIVTNIGLSAFRNCRQITGITIPETVEYIDAWAFNGCTNLAEINFPKACNFIYFDILDGTAWLENQPDGVVYFGNSVLAYKGEMPEGTWIEVRDGTTLFCSRAFINQKNLCGVTLPVSLKTIGVGAFEATSIKDITIPDNVSIINWYALAECSELEKVEFMGRVDRIWNGVFGKCPNLKTILFHSAEPGLNTNVYVFDFASHSDDGSSIYDRATLYVPAGSKTAYESVEPWSKFTKIEELEMLGLTPLDGTEAETDYEEDLKDAENLEGTIVDNIYYALNASNGDGYDEVERCIVLNSPLSADNESELDNTPSLPEGFYGLCFQVPAGTGQITIDAETIGSYAVSVKVGTQTATRHKTEGRQQISVDYSASQPDYVYVFPTVNTTSAQQRTAAVGTNAVKVYGMKWAKTSDNTAVRTATKAAAVDNRWFNLNGQQVNTPSKGVYIKNGRKVVVK